MMFSDDSIIVSLYLCFFVLAQRYSMICRKKAGIIIPICDSRITQEVENLYAQLKKIFDINPTLKKYFVPKKNLHFTLICLEVDRFTKYQAIDALDDIMEHLRLTWQPANLTVVGICPSGYFLRANCDQNNKIELRRMHRKAKAILESRRVETKAPRKYEPHMSLVNFQWNFDMKNYWMAFLDPQLTFGVERNIRLHFQMSDTGERDTYETWAEVTMIREHWTQTENSDFISLAFC
ncbi:AKAP7 2'5' RNA ligase-like domain-containing protein [Ditylenchus destructor]|nr:AKAP7 2'5' RNA ligase-like domain-containing protein [Ditylenchus destructor]